MDKDGLILNTREVRKKFKEEIINTSPSGVIPYCDAAIKKSFEYLNTIGMVTRVLRPRYKVNTRYFGHSKAVNEKNYQILFDKA